jgi:hypothetical protein
MLILAVLSAAAFAGSALGGDIAGKRVHVTVKPGKDPNDLSGKQKAPGGTPAPDRLVSNDPKNCRADRFEGRKGTVRLYNYLKRWWPRGGNDGFGSSPGCRDSLHDEGRAVDFQLSVHNKGDRRAANQIRHFFLNRDSNGVKYAMARRFGIQELIWNCHIWTSGRASEGWRPYSRCPTSDDNAAHRNHFHLGQSWPGARMKTSAYTGWSFYIQP